MKDRHRLERGVRGKKLALGQCRGEAGSCRRRKDGACKLRRLKERTLKLVACSHSNPKMRQAGEMLVLLMQETENHCAVSSRMQERRSLDRKAGMADLRRHRQNFTETE